MITLPDNVTTATLTGMYVWANSDPVSNGMVGYGILLMIFAMTFFGTMRYGASTTNAMLVSLLATTMICGALTIMGVTSTAVLTIITIMLMMCYIWSYHN